QRAGPARGGAGLASGFLRPRGTRGPGQGGRAGGGRGAFHRGVSGLGMEPPPAAAGRDRRRGRGCDQDSGPAVAVLAVGDRPSLVGRPSGAAQRRGADGAGLDRTDGQGAGSRRRAVVGGLMADPGEILWRPPADVASTTTTGRYLRWLDEARGVRCATYGDLW